MPEDVLRDGGALPREAESEVYEGPTSLFLRLPFESLSRYTVVRNIIIIIIVALQGRQDCPQNYACS